MQVQVSLKIEIAATADLSHMEQPTGCATRCTSQAKWLWNVLCCIHSICIEAELLSH